MTKMRSEIAEQPQALRATLDSLLPRIDEVRALGRQTRQLLFIARGTSDNAAVYGRYLVESHAGRLSALAAPSIATTYKRKLDLDGVLAVAISQSGRTEEIVETLAWARDCGARTVGVTNGGADSPLAQVADLALCTVAGEEKAVPATKTYTTQLAALAVLALGLGAEVDQDDLLRVPDAVEKLVAEPGDLEAVVEGLADKHGVVVSGRGLAFSTRAGDRAQAQGGLLPARHGPVVRRPAARPDRRGRRRHPGAARRGGEQPDAAGHGRAGRAGRRGGRAGVHHRRRRRPWRGRARRRSTARTCPSGWRRWGSSCPRSCSPRRWPGGSASTPTRRAGSTR